MQLHRNSKGISLPANRQIMKTASYSGGCLPTSSSGMGEDLVKEERFSFLYPRRELWEKNLKKTDLGVFVCLNHGESVHCSLWFHE